MQPARAAARDLDRPSALCPAARACVAAPLPPPPSPPRRGPARQACAEAAAAGGWSFSTPATMVNTKAWEARVSGVDIVDIIAEAASLLRS
jgi:hypothetical protein